MVQRIGPAPNRNSDRAASVGSGHWTDAAMQAPAATETKGPSAIIRPIGSARATSGATMAPATMPAP